MMQTHTISATENSVVGVCQEKEAWGWAVRQIVKAATGDRSYNLFFIVFERDIAEFSEVTA